MLSLKKLLVFIIMLFNIVIIVACAQKNEREEILDYKDFSKEIFKDIKFYYQNKINKEKVVMSSLYVNKEDLSINFFNNEIEKRILLKGWKVQPPDFEDQKLYCYGTRNRMSIVYPKKEIYKNANGDILNIRAEDLDKWVISFIYNSDGVRKCI